MGLFNVTLADPGFYALAKEGSFVIIDRQARTLQIEGTDHVFHYQQSEMEKTLLEAGGVLPLYNKFGRAVFRQIANRVTQGSMRNSVAGTPKVSRGTLEW